MPFSRVVEIDPATREVVWSYADEMVNAFFTAFMGNAQPLPNGNVHITESATGRLFEVTRAGQVVWEYVIPWFAEYPRRRRPQDRPRPPQQRVPDLSLWPRAAALAGGMNPAWPYPTSPVPRSPT